ncbi:MAG: glutathione S-transferase family protein [Geminicoccaceae bacterium]|jgi:glutathione S-transferase|nr:glutathione S-transferase family protein [Geminicoccaceae bacterium]HRY23197.1 glutathione S-transferase family protein [Geminicoccaceae bacterium]
MAEFKVTYFDMAGSRGEDVRLALVIAGRTFEDIRVDREAFLKLKPELPFGSLPVLEVEGHGVFSQTNAILRLIGRLCDLYPQEPFEAARHDALMDAVEDLRHRIGPTARIQDAAAKKAARQQLATDLIPRWGEGVERLIGQGPFVGGERPGVADIKLYMAHRWLGSGVLDDIPKDVLDHCPKLEAVANGIATHPAVRDWYAKAG